MKKTEQKEVLVNKELAKREETVLVDREKNEIDGMRDVLIGLVINPLGLGVSSVFQLFGYEFSSISNVMIEDHSNQKHRMGRLFANWTWILIMIMSFIFISGVVELFGAIWLYNFFMFDVLYVNLLGGNFAKQLPERT